ncbi:MAG: NusA-like transcription termination signal-binding factor [Thermoplasmata archaeon]|jgi:N utilization substance protein A|nr:NusA-like transcription termination signal-binding factor [Thermoplasmatales archaeon]PMP75838.1 MAG: NusA-like transcription termination signal-binding factor [Aciduliprofundum sp.]HEU12774.1 NusA-like transcription termination signal-binding factor [Euryarchaeota archaeon]
MGTIKIDEKLLGYMSQFYAMTGVEAKDVAEDEENIFFLIYPRTLKKAIANNGENVKRLKERLGKNIIIVEYSDDLEKFVYNMFYRFGVKEINIEKDGDEFKIAVGVDPANKARAIGKNGRNLRTSRDILARYFNVSSLVVK